MGRLLQLTAINNIHRCVCIYFNLCNVVCVPRVEMVYIHTPLQKSSGPIPITSFHILGPVSIAPFPIHVVFLWSFCLKWN